MRVLRFLSLFLLPVALAVGCGEQNSPTALDEAGSVSSFPVGTANVGNPVVLSVTGSGQTTAVGTEGEYAGIEGWRTFSLNVLQRADGSVSGHAQYNNRTNGGSIQHGDAVCIHETGYQGWVAVGFEATKRIAEFDPLPPPGTPFAPPVVGVDHGFVLIVQDNGEGAAASADQITGAANTTMFWVNLVCAGALDQAIPGLAAAFGVPVEAGNIQVRP
jgi:hypothetical protein